MACHRKKFVNEDMYKEVMEHKERVAARKERLKKKAKELDSEDEGSSSEDVVTEYVGKPKYMFDKYKEIIKTKRINKKLDEKRLA